MLDKDVRTVCLRRTIVVISDQTLWLFSTSFLIFDVWLMKAD